MIHALPGLGADRRMFPGPWLGLPDFAAHDWVRYGGEGSLSEMAVSMCEAAGIRDGDSLVGASLGGMVACEITKIRRIPAVWLIGSAVHNTEINRVLAVIHPLARVAPMALLRFAAGAVPLEMARMFADAEPSFVRAMPSAIFKWEGLGATETRVFRIHGRRDRVISPPVKTDLLLDGGHLISMTRARECVEFIAATGEI